MWSAYMVRMGKALSTGGVTRKSVTLPDTMWLAIDGVRRGLPRILPESDVIRLLLREALEARRQWPLQVPADPREGAEVAGG